MNHQLTFSAADGNGAALATKSKHHPLTAVVFYALLVVILLIPIPYGAADPWWKAALEFVIFGLAIVSLVEFSINPDIRSLPFALVAPVLAMIAFAFFQTLLPGSNAESSTGAQVWRAISADPLATRLWAMKMLAFLLMGLMLARYTSSVRRLKWLIVLI